MRILGTARLSAQEVRDKVNEGWRFLQFEETRSFVIFTQRKYTDIYFVPPYESHLGYAKKHILITALFGWWGIPWGLVGTPMSILRNFRGGRNMTHEVVSRLNQH